MEVKDILFQSAETHAAQLIKKLADLKVAADFSEKKILRDAEIEYIERMVYQAQDIEKNIKVLRRRVAERKS